LQKLLEFNFNHLKHLDLLQDLLIFQSIQNHYFEMLIY